MNETSQALTKPFNEISYDAWVSSRNVGPLPPEPSEGIREKPKTEPESVPSQTRQYWWLNTNPKMWNIVDQPIGDLQTYTAYNEQGNKRRIYKYFQEVKPGIVSDSMKTELC